MSVVQTLAPLAGSAVYTSSVQFVQRATQITGTVFADEAGTISIQQGGDGLNWDSKTNYSVSASTGLGFEVDVLSQYWRIVYTNGSSAQTILRLYADPRDPYGDFIAASSGPSAGGAYAVLQATSNDSYVYVGRFDAFDGWGACQGAAISVKQNGKYAAFLVDTATVSDETILQTTEHSPDSF